LDSLVDEGAAAARKQVDGIRRFIRRKRRVFRFPRLDPRSIFRAAE